MAELDEKLTEAAGTGNGAPIEEVNEKGKSGATATVHMTGTPAPKKQKASKPKKKSSPKPKAKRHVASNKSAAQQIDRPYPRVPLEDAIKVAEAIKQKNGGNPWAPDQLATAVGTTGKSEKFFYLAGGARDFGLTTGGRGAREIALTELGRNLVYAGSAQEMEKFKREAFNRVEVFRKVLDFYGGNNLPEMDFLSNTLEREFGLHPATHDEFSELFRKNCDFLQIGARFDGNRSASTTPVTASTEGVGDIVTVAEAEADTGLTCFVAMPFNEKSGKYPQGYFQEVMSSLIAPAGRKAGFNVVTARRQGSDVIQSTIVNSLVRADLVLVDLTEHNPNVLFELGLRIAKDKPVVLVRARGTAGIFDVDNMLRVYDYDPNLWSSTLKTDVPKLTDHIKGAWDQKDLGKTYMQVLMSQAEN